MLESITGWIKKSRISSKLVFNHFYWLLGVFKIQILYFDLFLDLFWTIFGLRRPKTGQKIKIVDFPLFFVPKFFLHTIFCILFFWMETIYHWIFFSLRKIFPNFFFQSFSFGPPYGCFFFLWGTKGSCRRFELQQSCNCALWFSGG